MGKGICRMLMTGNVKAKFLMPEQEMAVVLPDRGKQPDNWMQTNPCKPGVEGNQKGKDRSRAKTG